MPGPIHALTRRELALAATLLGGLALALYLPHAFQSGFYTDDWDLVARAHFGRNALQGTTHGLSISQLGYRPLASVLFDGLTAAAGTKPSHYALYGVGLAGLEGALLYALVRSSGLARLPAASIGVAIVIAPWIDATRLWMATDDEPTAVCLVLAGMLLALAALRASAWRARLGHAVSLLMYLAACLLFEGVIPLVAMAAILYAVVVTPWAALRRWPFDLLVALVGFVINLGGGVHRGTDFSPGHLLDRADQVSNATIDILDRVLPVRGLTGGPLGFAAVIAAVLGLGILVGRGDRLASGVRRLGAALLVGLGFAVAGLLALLPASAEFTPAWEGAQDRMSVAAAPGEVVALVAAAWLLGIGLAFLIRRKRAATPIALFVLVAIGVGLVAQEHSSQQSWTLASQEQHRILEVVTRALGPSPPPGTSVATFRHAVVTPANAPIFETSWDLKGALQLRYGDRTLRAHPVIQPIACAAEGMAYPDPGGPPDRSTVLPYARLVAVDTKTGTAVRVPSQAACAHELPRLLIP